MPSSQFHAGYTYLIEIPDPAHLHLFIIILEPNPKSGQTIILPIDSANFDHAPTVELKPGDHSFISIPSFVSYSFARIVTISELENLINEGKAIQKEPISRYILQKILDKLPHSKVIKNDVRDFYINETWKL